MKKIVYLPGLLIFAVLIIIGSGIRFDVPVEKLKSKYANEHSKFVVVDRLSVHYRDEGKGFPLVLLHGSPSSLHTWDGTVTELSKRFRVIRLDLPGYGLTGPNSAHDYSLEWNIRFLDSFLTTIGIDSCYMVGHSFGGKLAAEYAYVNSKRVKKLVLIGASGYPVKANDIAAVKMARNPFLRPIVRYVTPRFFIALNIREAFGQETKVSDATIDRYYDLLLRAGNRATFIAVCNREVEDISSHIKELRVPSLILWGNRDTIMPVGYAEYFHRDIPGSRVIVYDGVGHVPQECVPNKVAADMKAFL